MLEHVSHVQVPSDVGRGQQQREHRLALLWRPAHSEQVLFDSVFGPARLDSSRIVGFRQFVWHIGITGKARSAAPHTGELFRINARGKGGQTTAPRKSKT